VEGSQRRLSDVQSRWGHQGGGLAARKKIHVAQILALMLALAPERVDRKACRRRTRLENWSGRTERVILDELGSAKFTRSGPIRASGATRAGHEKTPLELWGLGRQNVTIYA